MEQEEKYEEFIDKYNRIIKENDVHKIKKPENYEELKYTSEEKQNYMIAMLKIYGIFSDEMYKLYTEISKYMSDIKEQEIMYDIKFLRIECICQYSDATIQAFKIQHENNQYNFDGTFSTLKIYKEEILKLKKEAEEHDKKILEMMGIFLSIFSVIGLGVSSVLNSESNHIAIWLMICGTILITMSGLFNLINPDKFNKQEKKAENSKCKIEKFLKGVFDTLRKPIIIGVILLLLGGVIRCKFPNDNEELVKKEKFEQVEKRVQNNENELLDKNLDYRNQIKDLKEEIKKLQSKVEKLEKRNS
ncbi:hypothetical protein [uncultured Parvimonas sp.]|uniref:hypothetical protein n=1 Tax=uncultured Parvimonas sp. TaxID=747372 RepID=UPI00325FBAB3